MEGREEEDTFCNTCHCIFRLASLLPFMPASIVSVFCFSPLFYLLAGKEEERRAGPSSVAASGPSAIFYTPLLSAMPTWPIMERSYDIPNKEKKEGRRL